MKVPYLRKISTKLFFPPLLFMLLVFAAFCAGFYYLSPQNPFEDFHRQHLINLLSEKRLAVDMWFEHAEKSVEYLSNNDFIREAASTYDTVEPAARKGKKKTRDTVRDNSQSAARRLLDDMVLTSPCKMFALLLKDGRIISSSQKELIGSNWSDRDFFKGAITELQSPSLSVRVFYSADSGIIFLAPIFDDRKSLIGLIYATPNGDNLARLLHVERGVYKTEKVEMLDKEGNLILTQKGFPDKKMKYNLPKNEKDSSVRLRDNLFFFAAGLESTPFRIIATVENQEVMQPLNLVLALSAIFAGLFIILFVFQSAYSGPKLI
jgi:hypothetical protein